jgi:hypothetical protein
MGILVPTWYQSYGNSRSFESGFAARLPQTGRHATESVGFLGDCWSIVLRLPELLAF